MPKPDTGQKSRSLPTTPAINAPVRRPRRNIAIMFGMIKSRMVWLANCGISLLIRLAISKELRRDIQMDRQASLTEKSMLYIASHGIK